MPMRRLYIICVLAIYPINENFIPCSFYALVSRYLSSSYTFTIEQNNSAGRSDFEMMRIPGMDYYTDDFRYRQQRCERFSGERHPCSCARTCQGCIIHTELCEV